MGNIMTMWEVEYTDEFSAWWEGLTEGEQESVAHGLEVLRAVGPMLGRPHVDAVHGSIFNNMKELRIQHRGEPYRTLFAFDPRRTAILLVGGKKTGDERWYDRFITLADRLYEKHLDELRKEGLI